MSCKAPEESKLGQGNQRPKIGLARAFIPVLIASKTFDGSIKNGQYFPHYMSMSD